ncbi:MAG: DUF2058 domain-containing protein [Desulfocapsaceae bacterium]|nr:DUF2058 domain-containing protein [Desulfocapsaceae bacterium]
MGSTLQDQFLKMGLVEKKQANTVKKVQHQQRTQKGQAPPVHKGKLQAQKAQADKKEHSRLLNQKKNEERKEQETAAQVRQLIATNRIPAEGGETPYNFTDNNKIKRLFLPKAITVQLSRGDLAIVRQAGEYQIVPAEVARKVQTYNKNLIVVFHIPPREAPADQEDPYAAFQVPEDLIW